LKLLTVHSLAAHGTASLKAFISLLGTRVIPVPSLYLTGLTSFAGIRRFPQDLEGALTGSMELAQERGEPLLLYVGYLGNAEQVKVIREIYHTYRANITHLLVDPVSGDHGRIYVPQEVVAAWPELLALADWAFPNFTELKLYSGLEKKDAAPEAYMQAFQQRFPQLQFVATSLPLVEGKVAVAHYHQGIQEVYAHEKVGQHFGGTGDAFAAHFVRRHFFEAQPLTQSLHQAAESTLTHIRASVAQNSPDLLIE